jgi:hypothetical protein
MERGITTYLKRNNPVTVAQGLVNYKKVRSLLCLRLVALEASLEAERKKGFFRQNRWRFSKKAKCLIVFAIITVMLVSIFTILPKLNNSTPPGLIESAQTINSTVWMQVAANAWQYFQPGVGVDSNTGLPYAGGATGFHYFTDWDLGVYIQAVIDANKTGLIGNDGAWGSSARLEKVVSFLETRDLNAAGYPFWFYDATTRKDYNAISDLAAGSVDTVDTGRLFVALNNLRNFNSSLAQRINNIVYNGSGNRSDYAALVPSIERDSLTSTSIYAYYCWSGFASFWPNDLSNAPSTILNNIFSAGNVTTPQGVSLYKATILGDPLLCSVFELNNNDTRLMALARQVYLAHEAYYSDRRICGF